MSVSWGFWSKNEQNNVQDSAGESQTLPPHSSGGRGP